MKGFTTIHAGSARQALTRLRFICQLSDTSNELPMSALNSLVSEAIDVVVHCVRTPEGPRVSTVLCVEDNTSGSESTTFTATEVFTRTGSDNRLTWTGDLPSRATGALTEAGLEIRDLLKAPSVS